MNNLENDIKEREISRLCHFTKVSKLLHILRNESGIISNTNLDDQLDLLEKNDHFRYDGKEDFVCCSVEYPNTWYLSKIKDIDPVFNEWVVLLINPRLILKESTLFCHRNAAADRGRHIKSGEEAFRRMFNNPVQGKILLYRSPNMLNCCPTDGQAEVLIHNNISRSDIIGIAVPSKEHARKVKSMLSLLPEVPKDLNWIVAPELFNSNWSQKIKAGIRPIETPYIEE